MCISSSVPKVPSKSQWCILFWTYFQCRNRKCHYSARKSRCSVCSISESYCCQVFKYNFRFCSVYYVPNRLYNFPLIDSKTICILKDTCQQISCYFTAAHHLKARLCTLYNGNNVTVYRYTGFRIRIRINLNCWIRILIQNADTETLIQ